MLIVNLFGGPGSGKSTTAAGVFHLLKLEGVNCEYVQEFAKDLCWEGRSVAMRDQLYVLGKQHHRIHRLQGKVDVVVTDAPLLVSHIYGEDWLPESFFQMVMDLHLDQDNMNFFIDRVKPFQQAGRLQDEEQATRLDDKIKGLLVMTKSQWQGICGDHTGPAAIVSRLRDSGRVKGLR